MAKKSIIFLLFVVLFFCPLLAGAVPFVIVSDTHVGAEDSLYAPFIKRIEEERLKVIFHTGDAIDIPGNEDQWARFFALTGQGKTLYLAPGNHDMAGRKGFQVYGHLFPAPYYSVAHGDTLFLLLSTDLPGEQAKVTGGQLAWLSSELERPFPHKFVFFHRPLYPFVPLRGLDRYQEFRDVLHRLFVEKGVSAVFSGHDHIYVRTARDGVLYVILPALRGQQRFTTKNGQPGYVVGTMKGGRYSFTLKDLHGSVMDEFAVEAPGETRRANP